MNNFISFDNLNEPINYFFSKYHFILLFISLVIIIFFSMYATRQKLKFQKMFVFFNAIFLIIIEGLRIFWRYKYLEYNKQNLNFINVTQIDFFTLSLWISIPIILTGSIVKKKNSKEIFALPFVFSITMLAAIITLIYPININNNFLFYHCYNLMYIFLRSIIIMLGLFFAFAKWISVDNFLDLWKAFLSLIIFGIFCYIFTISIKDTGNLFFMSCCPIFEELGIYIAFPYHLLLLGAFLFIFQIIIFIPFRLYKIKQK